MSLLNSPDMEDVGAMNDAADHLPVEWARLRASQIQALATPDAIVVIPIASVEHHGPHLPTGVDTFIGTEIARRAALRARDHRTVLVTPTIWHGLAEMHMSLGGTLTLDLNTFLDVVRCICRSVVRQGFRRILLLNNHGGNIAALTAVTNDIGAEHNIAIAAVAYWQLAAEQFGAILEDQVSLEHACEGETSMIFALAPDLIDTTQLQNAIGPTSPTAASLVGPYVARWRSFAARSDNGTVGNPTRANADKGERLMEAAAEGVANLLCNDAFWMQTF